MKIRRYLILPLVALLLWTQPAGAGWDKTKPPNGPNSPAVSADIRNNWVAIETSLGSVNLLADPTFLIWQAGDTTAPAHWSLTSATIVRTGTGLGDTTRKVGAYAAKVTASASPGKFNQNLLPTGSFDDSFKTLSFSCGAWIKSSTGSSARAYIDDGVAVSTSAYHTGGGAFEWLTVTGAIGSSGTKVDVGLRIETNAQVAYLSGMTCVLGQIPPAAYVPAPIIYRLYETLIAGTLTTGTDKAHIPVVRPGIVKNVDLTVLTAPTGASLIIDVGSFLSGTGFVSMYSTRPTIVATASYGDAIPDSTYARRCLTHQNGGAGITGGVLSIEIAQVGSTIAGADLRVQIRVLEYARPLEAFLAYNAVN